MSWIPQLSTHALLVKGPKINDSVKCSASLSGDGKSQITFLETNMLGRQSQQGMKSSWQWEER